MHTLTQRLARGGGPRRQVAAAAGTIVVVVIVIAIVVGAGAPASSKGQSSGSTATGATSVQRRDLVETDTESGTLGYANAQTVFNRLTGTVTYLPNVGRVVKPGGTLYQVDGYPVILFNGSYPVYRDLTSGDTNGPDIEELNADLKAMGFDPDNEITVDQTWQDATTDAVERFQGSIGQTETGTLSLGQIVFLPGPQLVNAVDTTLGSTGGSSGASGDSSSDAGDSSDSSGAADSGDPTSTATPADYRVAGEPHAEFVDLTTSSAATANSTPAVTNPVCPSNPTTSTTTTPAAGCPAVTSPTTTTPAPTTTTPTTPTTTTPTPPSTSPLSGTPSASALEAIVKLLQTQNRLLQSELRSAKTSGSAGATKGSTSGSGSVSARSGGGGSSSASAASSGSGSSSSGAGSASSGAGSADPILSTTSTSLVVTVDLDATKQSEAKLHEPVTVELPDGSTVNGRITGVSPVATASSSGSSSSSPSASAPSATIPVTVSLEKHTDTRGLDQAAVSVNFEEQVANNVLSVPVTALLATQGGGYAVQEAAAPHKLIPVTPGLFAAGYVQVSGPDVQDGMQVTDSQG